NERFYRGEQWNGNSLDLPQPVFNVVRRVIDYLVCAVVSGSVSVSYTDDSLPFIDGENTKQLVRAGVETLTKNAAYRWEREKMDEVMYKLMLDAAVSGDGILYCYWDPAIKTGQPYSGDIVTEIIDNTNLFVADVNSRDLQKQDYIILSGREAVHNLRAEAIKYGAAEEDAAKIVPDSDNLSDVNGLSYAELNDPDSEKATCLIKFWRQDGVVWFEKSTRNCVIRRASTGMKRYPVCYFNWYPTKNSFHGTAPVSGMIANQKFINTAYAMVMKHMTDTAFSKVIYDKTKIPEWSNEVGEASSALLAGYGLGPEGAITLTLKGTDGSDRRISFGSDAGEGLVYALVHNGTAIVTVDSALKDMASSGNSAFGDARLFPYESSQVSSISIVDGGVTCMLAKNEDGSWRMDSPVSAAASITAVDAFVSTLLALRGGDSDDNGVEISISGDERKMRVSRESLGSNFRLENFRSLEILKIDSASVRRLSVTGTDTNGTKSVVYDRDRRAWSVEASSAPGKASESGITRVLGVVNPLEA
ncbi:MAG: DUF4340 domain-containing protein, partial [Clostridia bacterium]|nr:DUF4340 domain-containing protein [Clostridia bacterium]